MSYNYLAPPESYFPSLLDEENDLDHCTKASPHVVTFWNAVCAYINHEREHGEDPDRVLECPSWGQWRSIGQHFAAGKKVEAIKLLRASTYAWTQVQPALPPYITNEKWKAFMAANATRQWDHRGGLSLSEAKNIIKTLENYPQWFGRDTGREFSPRHVTCADGGHVIGGPKSLGDMPRHVTCADGGHVIGGPKSLGDLLREKIAATREEPPREDPEKPEHSLWLNIYPLELGYYAVYAVARGSREEADQRSAKDRIACLNITFKEGEGL
jgi:hypothetical protein